LETTVSKLTVKGISKTVATSLCTWLGIGGSVIASYLLVCEVNDWVKKYLMKQCIKRKKD